MPIYEYLCQKCEGKFEVIQKFSDEPLTEHAGCGGSVERLVSAPAFQFKGTGWYITDYAKSGGGTKGEEKKKSEGDKGGSDTPAAKTETKSKSESKASGSDSAATSTKSSDSK